MKTEIQTPLDKDVRALWTQRKSRGFIGWHGFSIDEESAQPTINLYVTPDTDTRNLMAAVSGIQSGARTSLVRMEQFGQKQPLPQASGNKVRDARVPISSSQPTVPIISEIAAGTAAAPAPTPKFVSPGASLSAASSSCPPECNGVTGTIGVFLKLAGASDQRRWILGNFHVLVKLGQCIAGVVVSVDQAPVSDIVTPVPLDRNNDNKVDAAIALINRPQVFAKAIYPPALGLRDNIPATPTAAVSKLDRGGATVTSGSVVKDRCTMEIADCSGAHSFSDQILIQSSGNDPFACLGDSGSLVVQDGHPVGMLISEPQLNTCSISALVTPFQTVLDELQRALRMSFEMVPPES